MKCLKIGLSHIIKGLGFQDRFSEMFVFYAIWASEKLFWQQNESEFIKEGIRDQVAACLIILHLKKLKNRFGFKEKV